MTQRRSTGRLPATAAALGASAAACVAYGAVLERHWFRQTTEVLPGALRPEAPRPLRVLHVTDLHLDPPQRRKVGFIAGLADLDYDLVVATGDLLGAVGSEDDAVAALAPLTANGTPGLAVYGSNDFYGPSPRNPLRYFMADTTFRGGRRLDTRRLRAGLEDTGWRVLANQRVTVTTARGEVDVAALMDPHLLHLWGRSDTLPSGHELALVGRSALRLGLVHAPYLHALDILADAGADVILAGHTHGGQVRLPGVGALVTNCDLPTSQARGVSRHRDAWLHVSAGLGTSRYAPYRFACRPEATLLTLLS